MTDRIPDPGALPKPNGWSVVEMSSGDLALLPVWLHRDSEGDTTMIIAHPGGVIVDGRMNPDVKDVRDSALSVLAACQAVEAQRIHGQEAVRKLLDEVRPPGETATMEDLIERGRREHEEHQQRQSGLSVEGYEQVSQLFASLKEQLDQMAKDHRDDQPGDDSAAGGDSGE